MEVEGVPGWARTDRYWDRIGNAFRTPSLRVTRQHETASEILRNSHVILGEAGDRPWATRFYIEGVGGDLGFLHFRGDVEAPRNLLFEAYLNVPGRYRDFDVISSPALPQLYGLELGQPATAYMVPNKHNDGLCGQIGCEMVLVNLVPQGASCLGAFDISRIAFDCDDTTKDRKFRPRGLTPRQMLKVLVSRHSGVYGCLDIFPAGDADDRICDLLAGYVRSGCPVILCVDALEWLKQLRGELPEETRGELIETLAGCRSWQRGHAIVVIGSSRGAGSALPEFVIHDSLTAPYVKVPGADLLGAARQYCSGLRTGRRVAEPNVRWIAGVPRGVRRSASSSCRVITPEDLLSLESHANGRVRITTRLWSRGRFTEGYLRNSRKYALSDNDVRQIEDCLRGCCGDFLWVFEARAGRQWLATKLCDATRDRAPFEIGAIASGQIEIGPPKSRHTWPLRKGA